MVCNIAVQNIADAMVEWDPIGEITGFADGEDSISVEWSEEGENSMKVAADGSTGTISANERRNGMVKLMLNPGSPYVDVLRQVWQNARTTLGNMNITNTATGESHLLECTVLKFIPNVMMGSEAPDSYEFMFLFLRSTSTPRASAASRIQVGASITI
jgi:hypothetical protein